MPGLRISDSLTLPLDAVTETFAIMAMRGVGKTHTASVMAEEMLKAHQPIVVYDPTGAWFGLKTSADGKQPGFQVVIFGGEHADVPLEEGAGEIVAKAVVEHRISAIIDCSLLRKAARIRFMTAFAEELYRLNREPLHLFLDEAHTVAPQNLRAMPEAAKLLGALEDIVTQGRRRGLGMTTITQRPALLNSTLRNVCGTLIVMRVQGPHDRKAIQEWIEESQANPEQAKQVLPSLATLPRGEGWIWSPAWLGKLERVKFRQRETFDSSSTPEVGKKAIKPQAFAEVDIAKLGEKIKATVERAQADDPKTLRKQIADLQRQLAQKPAAGPVERIDTEALIQAQEETIQRRFDDDIRNRIVPMLEAWILDLKAYKFGEVSFYTAEKIRKAVVVDNKPAAAAPLKLKPAVEQPKPKAGSSAVAMPKACRSVLTALAQHGQCTKSRIAALTGYAINGGGFNNSLSACRTAGWLEGSDPMSITEAGMDALGEVRPLPSGEELLQMWNGKLGKAEREILAALVADDGLDKETIAELTGYAASGGGFNNAISRLRTLELIEGKGTLRLTPDFAEAIA